MIQVADPLNLFPSSTYAFVLEFNQAFQPALYVFQYLSNRVQYQLKPQLFVQGSFIHLEILNYLLCQVLIIMSSIILAQIAQIGPIDSTFLTLRSSVDL